MKGSLLKKATVGLLQISQVTMDTLQNAYAHALKLRQSLSDLYDQRSDMGAALTLSDKLVRELGRVWATDEPDDQTELRP